MAKRKAKAKAASTPKAASAPKAARPGGYPVDLAIDYPDKPQDKATVFFRLFLAIPIWILMALLLSGGPKMAAGFVVLPTLLMILFRQKYPAWWFEWNTRLMGLVVRVMAYLALLSDAYPATDDDQGVHVVIAAPKLPAGLNRWLPLVKWFLAIPHYIVLAVLSLCALVLVMLSWFAILFTGHMPKGWFDFIAGVFRWHIRVAGYAFLLVTDEYPPFSLSA